MTGTTRDLELPMIAPTSNPALSGWRAPVRCETTSTGPFERSAAVPPGLEGRFFWLGPNPALVPDPDGYDSDWGDGMAHSLELRDGEPVEQRSRLVVTRQLARVLGARPPEGPLEAAGPVASRSLACFASRLVALDGAGLGYRLTLDLRTACVEDLDAMLSSPMGTQVIVDPTTGEAVFLGVDPFGPPWLRLHRVDRRGVLVETVEIDEPSWLAEPALGILGRRALVLESSLAAPVLRGEDDQLQALRFDPERAPRVGIVPLGGDEPITWATSEPGHVAAVAATREGELGPSAFVLRSSPERWPDPDWWPPGRSGRLERVDVNRIGRGATITPIDELALDVLDGDRRCRQDERRFLYGVSTERSGEEGALIVRYDLVTGAVEHHATPHELVVDAPLFVRDPEGRSDEEGWLVVPALDRSTDTSQLLVLDATSVSSRPVCVLSLPTRLPLGIRGLHLAPDEYR